MGNAGVLSEVSVVLGEMSVVSWQPVFIPGYSGNAPIMSPPVESVYSPWLPPPFDVVPPKDQNVHLQIFPHVSAAPTCRSKEPEGKVSLLY